MPTKKELARLGNYYLYLVLLGAFCFLMIKPLSPADTVMGHSLIEAAKQSVQFMIVDPTVKEMFMFFLLLYTTFVAIESLVVIRDCLGRLYYKNKGNNVTE